MGSEVWTRDEIQSPCIKICVIHPSERLCTGCHRTIKEILLVTSILGTRKQIIRELPNLHLDYKGVVAEQPVSQIYDNLASPPKLKPG